MLVLNYRGVMIIIVSVDIWAQVKRVLKLLFFIRLYYYFLTLFNLGWLLLEQIKNFLLEVFIEDGVLQIEYDLTLIFEFKSFYLITILRMISRLLASLMITLVIEGMIEDLSMVEPVSGDSF